MTHRFLTTGDWPHIFQDGGQEWDTRWVVDMLSRTIVCADVRASGHRPWRPATPAELADLEDDLATNSVVDAPSVWELGDNSQSDLPPDWAADRLASLVKLDSLQAVESLEDLSGRPAHVLAFAETLLNAGFQISVDVAGEDDIRAEKQGVLIDLVVSPGEFAISAISGGGEAALSAAVLGELKSLDLPAIEPPSSSLR